jgi:hypothetical protein
MEVRKLSLLILSAGFMAACGNAVISAPAGGGTRLAVVRPGQPPAQDSEQRVTRIGSPARTAGVAATTSPQPQRVAAPSPAGPAGDPCSGSWGQPGGANASLTTPAKHRPLPMCAPQ